MATGVGLLTFDERHEMMRRRMLRCQPQADSSSALAHLYCGVKVNCCPFFTSQYFEYFIKLQLNTFCFCCLNLSYFQNLGLLNFHAL